MERHIRERKEKKALPGVPASAPTISEPLKKTDRVIEKSSDHLQGNKRSKNPGNSN